ncbi:hypothetical protein [Roseococcus pinisoli]|uniref:Uncharacterized protein n=1 Tax=Roseococcus pinisoli TaxID=2835040 RepID=A0ABS5QBY8_9PROT|nr:hypothetical protein [Roseococcus pinisoli]MBS7811214.1 hypothetical protein [Roseococcus pinisoli]
MPRDGTGTYVLPGNDFIPGETIYAPEMNAKLLDIANALSQSVSKDGQTSMTGNLPLGGYRSTDLGNASAATDALTLGQVKTMPSLDNLVINGDFRVNQREYVSGTTVAANKYTLDRWRVINGGAVTYTGSALGRTITIPGGVYYEQIIEDANAQPGPATISWEGTATGILNNATVMPNGGTITLPGGTTSISFSSGTLGKVRLGRGALAQPFSPRQFGEELLLCQRYYYRYGRPDSNGRPTLGMGIVVSNALIGIVRHPVRMRAAPAAGFGGSWLRFPQMEAAALPISTESNRDFMTWWSEYEAGNGTIRRLDGADANAWYSADAEY